MNDWITIVSVVGALICSLGTIAVTLVSGILKNKSDRENLEAEFYRTKKAEAIHSFVQNIGEALFRPTINLENNRTGESFGLIYLYTPEELWPDIDRLLELYPFTYKEYEAEGIELFMLLCKKLKEDTPSSNQKTRARTSRKKE